MVFKKYNLRVFKDKYLETNGRFETGYVNVIAIKGNLTSNQAKITIAHELGHFFYQYELNNFAERLTLRLSNIDVNDQGTIISEMIAHIVGYYGAEIQRLTELIIKELWKEA